MPPAALTFQPANELNIGILAGALSKVNGQPFQLAIQHAFQQLVPDVKVNLCGALCRRLGPPRQNPACQDRGNHVQYMFLLHVYLPAVTLGVSPRSNQAHSGIAPALHLRLRNDLRVARTRLSRLFVSIRSIPPHCGFGIDANWLLERSLMVEACATQASGQWPGSSRQRAPNPLGRCGRLTANVRNT
jgi:hypothetical protein